MELNTRGRKESPQVALRVMEQGGEVMLASRMPRRQAMHCAIARHYGPIEAVQAAFSPRMVAEIGRDYLEALKRPAPSLVCMGVAYTPELMEGVVLQLVAQTLVALGEEQRVDAADRASIARGLVHNRDFRTLSMTSVMQFFHRLQCGEIDTDGWLRPAKFLSLAARFARQAHTLERAAAETAAMEKEARERQEHDRHAKTWAEYKKKNGLPEDLTIRQWAAGEEGKEGAK